MNTATTKTTAKPIALDLKNKSLIDAMLVAVNGKADKHTFSVFEQLMDVAARADARLASLKLPLNLRIGAVWQETSGHEVANSYKFKRTGTRITIVRCSMGWALATAEAAVIFNDGGKGELTLTKAQIDGASKRIFAGVKIASL